MYTVGSKSLDYSRKEFIQIKLRSEELTDCCCSLPVHFTFRN